MVCGTASHAGKSLVVTGLCRALARRGLKVAPFKGQNMALNSIVTPEGREIGRAQGVQALAAGVAPEAAMNPILLKPNDDRTSQVMVMGEPWRTLDAVSYQRVKRELHDVVLTALTELRSRFDIVLCEGAGSPAEINLLDNDLVNLGLARAAGVPAIIVGDIDRGGVFAHLYGTVALLPDPLRAAVRGFVINKFRGDRSLLTGATEELHERTGVPTLGILPWLAGRDLDAEDSQSLPAAGLAPRFAPVDAPGALDVGHAPDALDVAVIGLPTLSNFTDLDPLLIEPALTVRLVRHPAELGRPDLVVVPGSKSTRSDLEWLRRQGIDDALSLAGVGTRGGPSLLGICGGYQMMGTSLEEPPAPAERGLGLLDVTTRSEPTKVLACCEGVDALFGTQVAGYRIHHGRPLPGSGATPMFHLEPAGLPEGACDPARGVYGTSLHGVLDSDAFRSAFLQQVAGRRAKRWRASGRSFLHARRERIDRMADACEAHLDMAALLELIGDAAP